jgi:hypothetical protein
MRRRGCVAASALLLCVLGLSGEEARAAGPQSRELGLGILLGEPSGLTGKYWLSVSQALDLHLSFDFSDEAFAVVFDYLFHFDIARLGNRKVELPFYVGIGGKLLVDADNKPGRADEDNDDVRLGLRVPLGLSVLLTQAPLEFFGEVGLGISVIPRTVPDLDGGLGVRYYF